MLFLLSPAKSLDYDTPWDGVTPTQPQFVERSAQLIELLRHQTPADLSQLMGISDALAHLNVARFQAWSRQFTAQNAKPAVLAFNGDVYEGLEARALQPAQLDWAQQHIAILSGLYGVLRPLDLMQPYRLEMGTALPNPKGANLYKFWGGEIAAHLDQRLAQDPSPTIVNLASQEYFKSVDRKVLQARVIECVFEEGRGGQFKVISFMAKRARGLMARYAITRKVKTPAALKKFNLEGYAFCPEVSQPERLVFRRTQG
jgi:cytoplasmic iron level regulating protein YaaA (DUF328/UPF0246 family)